MWAQAGVFDGLILSEPGGAALVWLLRNPVAFIAGVTPDAGTPQSGW